MNDDTWKGCWHEIRGKVRDQWGDLTDDELTESQGRRENLTENFQQKYGGVRADISRKLDELAA